MDVVPVYIYFLLVIWVAVSGWFGWMLFQHRGKSDGSGETGLQIGGVILLALAPCIATLEYGFSGSVSFFGGGIHVLIASLLFAAAWRNKRYPDSEAGVSFKEKSAWIVLLIMVGVYFSYFTRVWGASLEIVIPAFLGAVIMLVILIVIGHSLIALFHHPWEELDEPEDERDRAIEMLSTRNAYYVLGAGFWSVPVMFLAEVPTVTALNVWFGFLVLSEVTRYASVVGYYRWGSI